MTFGLVDVGSYTEAYYNDMEKYSVNYTWRDVFQSDVTDIPIIELNGLSLNDVFKEAAILRNTIPLNYTFISDWQWPELYIPPHIENDYIYFNGYYQYVTHDGGNLIIYGQNPNTLYSSYVYIDAEYKYASQIHRYNSLSGYYGFRNQYTRDTFNFKNMMYINLTYLGIDSLTVSQMDDYYDLWVEYDLLDDGDNVLLYDESMLSDDLTEYLDRVDNPTDTYVMTMNELTITDLAVFLMCIVTWFVMGKIFIYIGEVI